MSAVVDVGTIPRGEVDQNGEDYCHVMKSDFSPVQEAGLNWPAVCNG
jgi:hypothetical protein